jgi:NodT family efflux transporter outer membrane factor (OMF) lipoprotein
VSPRHPQISIALLIALAAASSAAAARQTALPRVETPATYAGAVPGQALATADLDRWWRLFADPALDALEDEALRASPDARTQLARLAEAGATRAAQTAETWPSGSIAAGASHQQAYAIGVAGDDLNPTGGVTDTVTGNFNVSWELDLFGRLKVKRRIAAAGAAEARFNVEGARASLAADVADAYFQAGGLAAQLEDARQTARIERDLLEIARRKADAGAVPADEVDRVAGLLAQAEAQAADLKAQLEETRRRLLILVGRDLTGLDGATADPAPGEATPAIPLTPAALPAELLARRPDVREAEFRLRAELGTDRLAHLAIFPTLTLLPGLGLSSTSSPGVSFIPPATLINAQEISTAGFWTLGAGLTAPTLDIPRLLDQARAEDARAREAAIAYEKTVRGAFGEAQNTLADLAAGEAATALLAGGETRARRAYDASRRRYAEGLDDLTATLSAEQAWRGVRSSLTAERADTLRRAVRVYKALGGGWDFAGVQAGAGAHGQAGGR